MLLAGLGAATAFAQQIPSKTRPQTGGPIAATLESGTGPYESIYNRDGSVLCSAPAGVCQRVVDQYGSDPWSHVTVVREPRPGYKPVRNPSTGEVEYYIPESFPSPLEMGVQAIP